MTNITGYLRAGVDDANKLSRLDQLKAAGVSKIYQEKDSVNEPDTPQLDRLLADVRAGDTLVVTSFRSIARNTKHLMEIVETLQVSGATLKVLDQGIDTSTAQGETLCILLGAIVDFERQVVRGRQAAGIARAKREGLYKGRKPTARAKTDEVLALNQQGLTRQKIAEELGIGVASVYRILKANSEPKKPRRKIARKPEKAVAVKQTRIERKTPRAAETEQLSFF